LKTRRRRVIEAANETIDTYVGEEAMLPTSAKSDTVNGGEAANEAMIPAPAKTAASHQSDERSDDTCAGEYQNK
jgi:hypothetical protein